MRPMRAGQGIRILRQGIFVQFRPYKAFSGQMACSRTLFILRAGDVSFSSPPLDARLVWMNVMILDRCWTQIVQVRNLARCWLVEIRKDLRILSLNCIPWLFCLNWIKSKIARVKKKVVFKILNRTSDYQMSFGRGTQQRSISYCCSK